MAGEEVASSNFTGKNKINLPYKDVNTVLWLIVLHFESRYEQVLAI